ncbi:hypothetical protein HN865_00500 [Candidatus Woesearchaeota archaeon]|jgi:hypothetical protein|nr:hypothetical protein [Candidatus Woesearchaeota archaeon]
MNKKYNYLIFGDEKRSRSEREETVKFLNKNGGNGNATSVISQSLEGALYGAICGSVEGIFSAYAMPTSFRKIKDRFPQNVAETIDSNELISERVNRMAYHSVRLPTRLGFIGWGVCDAIENQNYSMLATNIISLGYELYRSGRGK